MIAEAPVKHCRHTVGPTGTILDRIVDDTRLRVNFQRTIRPLPDVTEACRIYPRRVGFPFQKALSDDGLSFICEVKKASPSKGVIAREFPYVDIAREYERIGASAISVLTEPKYFKGSDRYLEEISENVGVPLLRKDFIIDEYQIYQAKLLGASAVLLIASILPDDSLENYRRLAESLGMSALVEAHNIDDVERSVSAGARIIGINNRDLRDFTVDIDNSVNLRPSIPDGIIAVSESGISTRDDVKKIRDAGFDAVLMGESFMRSKDRQSMIEAMRD